jgi:hypothetical protein
MPPLDSRVWEDRLVPLHKLAPASAKAAASTGKHSNACARSEKTRWTKCVSQLTSAQLGWRSLNYYSLGLLESLESCCLGRLRSVLGQHHRDQSVSVVELSAQRGGEGGQDLPLRREHKTCRTDLKLEGKQATFA